MIGQTRTNQCAHLIDMLPPCSFRQRSDGGPAGEGRGRSVSWKVSRAKKLPQETLGYKMKLMLFRAAKASVFKTDTHEFQIWLLFCNWEPGIPVPFPSMGCEDSGSQSLESRSHAWHAWAVSGHSTCAWTGMGSPRTSEVSSKESSWFRWVISLILLTRSQFTDKTTQTACRRGQCHFLLAWWKTSERRNLYHFKEPWMFGLIEKWVYVNMSRQTYILSL